MLITKKIYGKKSPMQDNLKSLLNLEKGHVHSTVCHMKAVEDYNKTPKKCKRCDTIIPYEKRENSFCNRSCAGITNNAKNKKIKVCLTCGMPLFAGKKFCSSECHIKAKWQAYKAAVTANPQDILSKSNYPTIKKYLVEIRGYKCEICGLSEWLNKKLPLVLDHINGNSDNFELTNLRIICSNCDSLTPTYKGRNIGRGRDTKRQIERTERYHRNKE